MKNHHYKRSDCRFCGSTRLEKILDLGEHPPSNSFLPEEDLSKEEKFPLVMYWCSDCKLTQLLDVVSPKLMFGDYSYLSSTSGALKRHYRDMTDMICQKYQLQDGEKVLDVGCNDGIMLDAYTNRNLDFLGIEPSSVCSIASSKGYHIENDFLNPDLVKKIISSKGKAKIITATNVYPHVDDIKSFTECIRDLLTDDGVFVIEASYLVDLINKNLFDTIYHEHLGYLSATALKPFVEKLGLEIICLEKEPIGASGPAIRISIGKQGSHQIESNVELILKEEEEWGVGNISTYKDFASRIESLKIEFKEYLSNLIQQGNRVAAFGAPAKGNTLLNYFELDKSQIEYTAENNELKIGMLTPGSHIPIVSDETLLERMPDIALLLTWNYLDFFLENSEYSKRGGKFLVALPSPRLYEK